MCAVMKAVSDLMKKSSFFGSTEPQMTKCSISHCIASYSGLYLVLLRIIGKRTTSNSVVTQQGQCPGMRVEIESCALRLYIDQRNSFSYGHTSIRVARFMCAPKIQIQKLCNYRYISVTAMSYNNIKISGPRVGTLKSGSYPVDNS